MRRAAVAPGDEKSASNYAPTPGKMRSPQVVLTTSPPQELKHAPLGVIDTASDANHEVADDAGMRTFQSLREAGTQVRNLNRINGKQAARRAPQRPDAYLHAESWAEAHNLLFQGDMDDRPDGVPPGLISTDQLADIQMIWKKLGACNAEIASTSCFCFTGHWVGVLVGGSVHVLAKCGALSAGSDVASSPLGSRSPPSRPADSERLAACAPLWPAGVRAPLRRH